MAEPGAASGAFDLEPGRRAVAFGERVDGAQLLRSAVRFGRELRAAGLGGDLAAAIDFARILSIVDIGDREQVRAGGATLFVRRRDDIPIYDEVFERFWRARLGLRARGKPMGLQPPKRSVPAQGTPTDVEGDGRAVEREAAGGLATGSDATDDRPIDGTTTHPLAYSTGDVVRHRQFDRMSGAELREAERLIHLLQPNLELRRTRRQELHPHGVIVAPRAMFRRNLATGGEVLDWVWRRSIRRPRSIVVLCDISGSMERNSRLLLRFVHAIARTGAPTEAFVFGTRLTRVTRHLRERDPNRALDRIGEAASDWSGGTRIGDSFRAFNLRWARRVLRTSGVVIVMSDGWDRGDPALVAVETARLRRNCHRLVWLNPLASTEGYQPLAAGMAAAYPFIDDFVAAGSVASLERLGEILAGESANGRVRSGRIGKGRVANGRVANGRPNGGVAAGRRPARRLPADEAAAGRRASIPSPVRPNATLPQPLTAHGPTDTGRATLRPLT